MSEFEKQLTDRTWGERMRCFLVYDVDGHDVAASVYYVACLLCSIEVRELRYCSDRHLWEEKRPFKKGLGPCG